MGAVVEGEARAPLDESSGMVDGTEGDERNCSKRTVGGVRGGLQGTQSCLECVWTHADERGWWGVYEKGVLEQAGGVGAKLGVPGTMV